MSSYEVMAVSSYITNLDHGIDRVRYAVVHENEGLKAMCPTKEIAQQIAAALGCKYQSCKEGG